MLMSNERRRGRETSGWANNRVCSHSNYSSGLSTNPFVHYSGRVGRGERLPHHLRNCRERGRTEENKMEKLCSVNMSMLENKQELYIRGQKVTDSKN